MPAGSEFVGARGTLDAVINRAGLRYFNANVNARDVDVQRFLATLVSLSVVEAHVEAADLGSTWRKVYESIPPLAAVSSLSSAPKLLASVMAGEMAGGSTNRTAFREFYAKSAAIIQEAPAGMAHPR